MDITKLAERLLELPEQGVSFFEKGRLARKSYPEIYADVKSLEAKLEAWGVKPRMLVGILAENCYEWVVADLALAHMGCVSVCFPLEEFASDSIDTLAEQFGLNLVLMSKLQRKVRTEEREWIALLDGENSGQINARKFECARGEKNSNVYSLDSDVFSLVFSSGTSGKMKCLMLGKRGAEELIEAFGKHYAFRPDDSILVGLQLSGYQQRVMIYTAIRHGFDILLTDHLRFFRGLKEMRPTILGGPPMFYETVENRFRSLPRFKRTLLASVGRLIHLFTFEPFRSRLLRKWFEPFHSAFGGRIRIMLTGSAPSRQSTLDLFAFMGMPLYQVYGLTETGGFVSWNLPGANRPGSVGRLVFDGSVTIADDGEIIARYDNPRSHGYLFCDEAETRKTYIGDNRIATGDIGRLDEDGYLYITGRKKEIIITQGGYKIQPEMLEREIERCPDVSRAVVFGGGQLSGLVALISLNGNGDSQARKRIENSVDKLNANLYSASQIGRLVFTETQFRTDNGFLTRNLKIDRRAVYKAYQDSLIGLDNGHRERQ